MTTVDRPWLRSLKSNAHASDDFLLWLAEEKSKLHTAYSTAKTYEDFLKLQGSIEALDKILRIFTMQDRETQGNIIKLGKG